MTTAIRATLYSEARNYEDRNAYVSDMALSSVWGDAPDSDIPAERLELLGRIWDDTHCTVRELISRYNLTQTAFAQRFGIPLRTVQGWCCGERVCPPYLITMAGEILAHDK